MLNQNTAGRPVSHAEKRTMKRLAEVPSFGHLLEMIRENKAQFVCWGHCERPIYDVPYDNKTVRIVANKGLTRVITILPNEFRSEKFQRVQKQRRLDYFRGCRNRDSDEIGA